MQEKQKYIQTPEEKILMYEKQIETLKLKSDALSEELQQINEQKIPLLDELNTTMEQCEEYQRLITEFEEEEKATINDLNGKITKKFEQIDKQKQQLLEKIQIEYSEIEELEKKYQAMTEEIESLQKQNEGLSQENQICSFNITQITEILDSQQDQKKQLEEMKQVHSEYLEVLRLTKLQYNEEYGEVEKRAQEVALLEADNYNKCGIILTLLEMKRILEAL